METNVAIPLLEAVISFLKEKGKSEDVAALLVQIKVEEPGLLHDFLIELALCANPDEEEGVGCYPIDLLERALNEFKETGDTKLLNSLK